MIKKGIVDSIQGDSVTVCFPDMDNIKTPGIIVLQSPFVELKQDHKLQINDVVAVIFYTDNMKDGALIGRANL